jgi:Undecaprenyl-phosphate glucose phosphotransferase
MLREQRQFFEVLLGLADLLVVSIAWICAYWLRFDLEIFPVEKGVPPIANYLSLTVFILFIWPIVFGRLGLYQPMRGARRGKERWLLLQGNSLAILLFLAVVYLFREKTVPFSRLVFAYFWVLATIFTIVERSLFRAVLREIRRKGYNLRYVVVIGTGRAAQDIIVRCQNHTELGLQIVGCFARQATLADGPCGIPIIGGYGDGDLMRYLSSIQVDQVIVALPLEDHSYLPAVMESTRQTMAEVKIVPDHYQFISLAGAIEEFEGIPVLNVQTTPLDGKGRVIKRIFDITLALIVGLVSIPICSFIALLIKLTSKGPIFYAQERVSLDGTPFSILKFRTMALDAEINGPGWTKEGDNRIMPLGRFLRRYSLDEIPQIINVLQGDMSFVGPRPERPVFIREFRKRIPKYMLRHKVPAGITGWAQVNGWRGDTSIDQRIECDLFYIQNWSLLLDIKILFLTLFQGLKGKNAY